MTKNILELTRQRSHGLRPPLMYAVIETGSKQYRVAVGDQLSIEKLESNPGDKVTFPVVLIEEGGEVEIGNPHIVGAQVHGEIVQQTKLKKVLAYTYRKRKGSERKVGHRQPVSIVKITDIKGLKG